MATVDTSKMTDAEYGAYLDSLPFDDLKAAFQAPHAGLGKPTPLVHAPAPAPSEFTEGMSGPELFAAGAGKGFKDLVEGPGELMTGLKGNKEAIAALNAHKKNEARFSDPLLDTWQGSLGAMMPSVAGAMAAPMALGPQAVVSGLLGFLNSRKGPIKDGEIPSRLLDAGIDGGAALGVGALGKLASKTAGGFRGKYTGQGVNAMQLDDAARRLGIKRSAGDLYPGSTLDELEQALPGYPGRVLGQANAFGDATRVIRDIPSKSGKSFTPTVLEGESLRAGIEEAGNALKAEGVKLWTQLDDAIINNNLSGVSPKATLNQVSSAISKFTPVKKGVAQVERNPIYQRINDFDEGAGQLFLGLAQGGPKAVPFSEMHTLQSAVGAALGRAQRDASAPGASMNVRQELTELKKLYASLMNDVDGWGASTKNKEAKALFDDARTYWKEKVIPGTQNNKVYRKALKGRMGSDQRGYGEPHTLYSDVANNQATIDYLTPFMTQHTDDLVSTLNTLPNMTMSLRSSMGKGPAERLSPLTQLAGIAAGSPFQLARAGLSHIPGLGTAMKSRPLKKAMAGRDTIFSPEPGGPLGQARVRGAWGALQGPQESVEDTADRILGRR